MKPTTTAVNAMTDRPQTSADRAERLARLQQRRASGTTPSPATEPDAQPAPSTATKRAHPASGGRIVAAGLSASAALALLGTIAAGAPTTTATASPTPDAPRYVYVTTPNGAPATVAAMPTPAPAQPAPRAVTRSGGS
jgi:hypothetical protein